MPEDIVIEMAAVELWHRFSPSHRINWDDEPHKDEYREAARAALIAAEVAKPKTP